MSCSDCKYLDTSKKRDGSLCGSCYYCIKKKKYVLGSDNFCEKYEKSYSRLNYECSKIYNDGENFCDDDKPTSFYVIFLIILVIILLIMNV